MPLNTPPLNDRERLEKVSVDVLNVNDPEALPETPVRFTLLKQSPEQADADSDTASRNITHTVASLKRLIMTLLQPYKSTACASLDVTVALSRLRILATGCKGLQY
jgi:hypothetical protein